MQTSGVHTGKHFVSNSRDTDRDEVMQKNADPEQFVSYKIAREIEASGFVKRLYENEGRERK